MQKHFIIKATGEAVTLVRSSIETNGKLSEFLVTLPADAPGPPPHIHSYQSEYFEVLEGKLGLLVGDEKIILLPGQSHTVPKNTIHTFYNAGNSTIKMRGIFKPALNFEYLAEEMISAANRSFPHPPSKFEVAYILSQAKGEYYLADVSKTYQKITTFLFAKIGILLGKVKKVRRL